MNQLISLDDIEVGSFAPTTSQLAAQNRLRVISWNINRGCCFDEILEFLASIDADLIFLQECDRNAMRSGGRNVAREIAQALRLNYIFAIEFSELSQASGTSPAHHGQATLCRWPLSNPRVLRFTHQSSFWKPRWFLPNVSQLQRRLGGRIALICEINLNQTTMASYNLHLESRGDDGLRYSQMCETLDDCRYAPSGPIVIAGDFNFELTQRRTSAAIQNAGFRNAFASQGLGSTIRKRNLGTARAIDWILVREPLVSAIPCVHISAAASDHYPLSLTLSF